VVPLADLPAEGGTGPDGGFDPVPRFAARPAPVLCVWGADDDVSPLDESVARMRPILAAGGHPASQLRVLPGANHLLYVTPPAPEGLPADVMQRRLHQCRLAPGARELMVEWALPCVGR
jgi:pimeloyl-ACP methyl ester carboxylesterase